MKADPRLIVALDAPDVETAKAWVAALGDSVSFYKVGMELVYSGGLPFARELVAGGKDVFIDLKLHDIPETVQRASAQIARLGAKFLTVHAYPQTMRAALAGVAGTSLGILGVSVLTSSDDADLRDADVGDQKRVATPSGALKGGADYLVVGRPITRAADPRKAAEAIVAEMAGAGRYSINKRSADMGEKK